MEFAHCRYVNHKAIIFRCSGNAMQYLFSNASSTHHLGDKCSCVSRIWSPYNFKGEKNMEYVSTYSVLCSTPTTHYVFELYRPPRCKLNGFTLWGNNPHYKKNRIVVNTLVQCLIDDQYHYF